MRRNLLVLPALAAAVGAVLTASPGLTYAATAIEYGLIAALIPSL